MKNKTRRTMGMFSNERGTNLIELMIATIVLGVGILALIQLQVSAMGGNSSGNYMTTATTLAQDEIERLKNLPLTDAALTDSKPANNGALSTNPANAGLFDHPDPNNDHYNEAIDERGGTTGVRRYRRFWNVADNTPVNGVKTVVVFVYWGTVDANGLTQHQVILPTVIGP